MSLRARHFDDSGVFPYVHPNGEDGVPDNEAFASCPTRVKPILLRYLIDLQRVVRLEGSRPDVVDELEWRIQALNVDIGEMRLRDGWFCTRSMEAQAQQAIDDAKCPTPQYPNDPTSPLIVHWESEARAVVAELCCADRLCDLLANALEWGFSRGVSLSAADKWRRFFEREFY